MNHKKGNIGHSHTSGQWQADTRYAWEMMQRFDIVADIRRFRRDASTHPEMMRIDASKSRQSIGARSGWVPELLDLNPWCAVRCGVYHDGRQAPHCADGS